MGLLYRCLGTDKAICGPEGVPEHAVLYSEERAVLYSEGCIQGAFKLGMDFDWRIRTGGCGSTEAFRCSSEEPGIEVQDLGKGDVN